MSYDTLLNIALVIFFIGVIYKFLAWFFKYIGTSDRSTSIARRVFSGIEGLLLSIFSLKIFSILKVFILDVLLQLRILSDKKDRSVWIMHILIFIGFIALLILHTFKLPASFSSDYYSTTNPLMFLRNLFGLMVLVGLALAILRRAVWMKNRVKTGGMDIYAIIVIAVIMISGFLLEGIKITSHNDFVRMIDEYAPDMDDNEMKALEVYWVKKYSVVSPDITDEKVISPQLIAKGEAVHQGSCLQCHDRPQSAFLSYSIAQLIKPVSVSLVSSGIRTAMWYIHILACFIALAYLPFSKLYHAISTPISLFVAEVAGSKQDAADSAIRQVIELDGCSHGGVCHDECPVRKRRQERISSMTRFGAYFDYIDEKSSLELGSREVKG